MAEAWRISKSTGTCSDCGQEFSPGQSLVSALEETETEFVRRDFCSRCWEAKDVAGFFCHWKTRRPAPTARRAHLDTELMLEFFDRLESNEAPDKKAFRFVVGLYLIRRKALALVRVKRDGDLEKLVVERKGTGTTTEIENPQLSEEQLQSAASQLSLLFDAEI